LNRNSSKVIEQPLKRLKEKMDLLTLFEVMDRLITNYADVDESSINQLKTLFVN